MTLFKPTVLRAFLNERGIKPNKALSQNFLVDGNILNRIIEAGAVSSRDLILEIGPGPGVFTQALLAKGAEVLAIEKDPKFGDALSRLGSPQLECIIADFLNINIEEELKSRLEPGKKAKVIANIPYHITGIILQRLLPLSDLIESLTLIVQKEVVDRCVSHPKSKNYSSFTIFTRYYSTPKALFDVPASCFYPKPQVGSGVIQFRLHAPPKEPNPEFFFKVLRTAFKKRRKMMRSSLKEILSPEKVEETLEQLGFKKTARPEELSLEKFLAFVSTLLRAKNQEKNAYETKP